MSLFVSQFLAYASPFKGGVFDLSIISRFLVLTVIRLITTFWSLLTQAAETIASLSVFRRADLWIAHLLKKCSFVCCIVLLFLKKTDTILLR